MELAERHVGAVIASFAAALIVSWLLAMPALAQANAEAGDVQIVDCSQVINVIVSQGQYGDASAVADGIGNAAAAEVANELGITVDQVNGCLGGVNGGGDDDDGDDGNGDGGDDNGDNGNNNDDDNNAGDTDDPDDVVAGTTPNQTLSDTGGVPIGVLMAGLILAGSGLLLRGALRRES